MAADKEKSLFIEYVNKYFKGIVVSVVEKLNDKANNILTYLFKEMLRKEPSVTGKWESISTLNTRVSADYVAMDSTLPLKRRDSIRRASGVIAKSGMELWLNETQLTELDIMVAQRAQIQESDIVAKLFVDTPRVIAGIYELTEKAFLQGLSTGVTEIEDHSEDKDKDNVGLGIRLDFGYLDANKFGVVAEWANNPTVAKPLDDFRKIVKTAKNRDGNTITDVWMDDVTLDYMLQTQQVREFFIWSINYLGDKNIVPAPTLEQLNAALKRDQKYRFNIHMVDRAVINEKNGVRTTVKPWEEGKVILSTGTQVGVLAWARLAEMGHPVNGVSYETVDDYILVSKFRSNSPLREYTTSQAWVVPVICNVEQIYQLDTKVVQA
jgi:hypothetical protein